MLIPPVLQSFCRLTSSAAWARKSASPSRPKKSDPYRLTVCPPGMQIEMVPTIQVAFQYVAIKWPSRVHVCNWDRVVIPAQRMAELGFRGRGGNIAVQHFEE